MANSNIDEETTVRTPGDGNSWFHRFFGQPWWAILFWMVLGCLLLLLTRFLYEFLKHVFSWEGVGEYASTPLAAAVGTIVGATIAAAAVVVQLRHNKQVDANSSWWETFQWAADRAIPPRKEDENALPPTVAAAMLVDLANKKFRGIRRSKEWEAMWESRQNACVGLAQALLPRLDPTSPLGKEVLESMKKWTDQTKKNSTGAYELSQQVGTMFEEPLLEKLRLLSRSHGWEVLDWTDIGERFNLSSGMDIGADVLVLKEGKGVWVELKAYPGSRAPVRSLRILADKSIPQLQKLAKYPLLAVFTSPVPDRRIDFVRPTDDLHFASEGAEKSDMAEKLEKLLE